MPDKDLYTYAALAEHLYRRHETLDQAIEIGQDGDIPGVQIRLAESDIEVFARDGQSLGKLSTDDIYYYSPRGFVGTIVQYDGKYVVVFRGTDTNLDGWASLQAVLSKDPDDRIGDNSSPTYRKVIDFGDAQTNGRLGIGTVAPTQWDDARALINKAIELAGGEENSENVVVVGQSLGGGLAGLASATMGVKGYAFAPAPFKKQLEAEASFAALQTILSNEVFGNVFSDNFHELNLLAQTSTFEFHENDHAAGAVILSSFVKQQYSGPENFNFLETIFERYFYEKALEEAYFNANLDLLQVHTIEGETLSNTTSSGPGILINAAADHFKPATKLYDVGGLIGPGTDEALHGPALHALVIRTDGLEGTDGSDKSFASLLKADDDLRIYGDSLLNPFLLVGLGPRLPGFNVFPVLTSRSSSHCALPIGRPTVSARRRAA